MKRFCRETLYGVGRVPSDTRERLDEVDPRQLRHCFTKLFQLLQRGKELKEYTYGHYVLSINGTGYFSSDKVHCQNCCEKHRRDGTTTYYHVGSRCTRNGRRFSRLVKDGARKNDCEAATRLLEDVRREHPHLKLVEDGLAGPHLLKGLDLRLGAKPGDHKFLFEWVNSALSVEHQEFTDENDIRLRYGVPLNDTHSRSEFSRILGGTPKRQETTPGYGSANQRGEAARRTSALEGTKLTLKNQGYCFEHNFGHGGKNLSTVFALMLAFLLNSDVASWQAQMEAMRSSYFQEKVRGLFLNCFLNDWETLYRMIAFGQAVGIPTTIVVTGYAGAGSSGETE